MKFSGAGSLALLIAVFGGVSSKADEIIYDNTAQFLNKHAAINVEYGDEITLGGKARTLTEFAFEYYGEFLSQGDELARVRFYKNDGPVFRDQLGRLYPDYHLPQTLLWESALFPVSQGFATKSFPNLNVEVPETIIWTIQFFGMTFQTIDGRKDEAGLLYYGLPTIGLSFNDTWAKRATGWQPEALPASVVAKNNFGARALAVVPEPSVVALGTFGCAVGIWTAWKRRRLGPQGAPTPPAR